MNQLPRLSGTAQGVLLIIAGIILILHVTGIITKSLDLVIILGALIMIAFGFIKIDGYNRLMNLFKKRQ